MRSHSFKWASFVKPSKSPTKVTPEVESPQPSPQRMEHDVHPNPPRVAPTYTEKSSLLGSQASTSAHTSYASTNTLVANPAPPRPQRQDSQDNLKSFKVSLDDPAWKVLPAALKKYKINNDDWQNYAMFICYGAPGASFGFRDTHPYVSSPSKLASRMSPPVYINSLSTGSIYLPFCFHGLLVSCGLLADAPCARTLELP